MVNKLQIIHSKTPVTQNYRGGHMYGMVYGKQITNIHSIGVNIVSGYRVQRVAFTLYWCQY
jgi:hypothetical protein